jgi:hypothetical protein
MIFKLFAVVPIFSHLLVLEGQTILSHWVLDVAAIQILKFHLVLH